MKVCLCDKYGHIGDGARHIGAGAAVVSPSLPNPFCQAPPGGPKTIRICITQRGVRIFVWGAGFTYPFGPPWAMAESFFFANLPNAKRQKVEDKSYFHICGRTTKAPGSPKNNKHLHKAEGR